MNNKLDKLVIASSNLGKIKEISALLPHKQCIPQQALGIPDADETGSTFIENALLKARHASQNSQLPAIADDSGLVVPALQGKPGIYSSRFAGKGATDQENINYLLNQLQDANLLHTSPKAFFYSVVVLMQYPDDPTPLLGTGILHGHIISKPKGTHGFGYSPIFYLEKYECTLSELPLEIKNTMSHRAVALDALLAQYIAVMKTVDKV